jgi:PAS domain S-box-containing protein
VMPRLLPRVRSALLLGSPPLSTPPATVLPEATAADRRTVLVVAASMFVVFATGLLVPIGLTEWVLYLIPIIAAHRHSAPRAPLVAACTCIVLMIVAYVFQSHRVVPLPVALLNRSIGAAAMLGTAVLLMRYRRAEAGVSRLASIVQSSGEAIVGTDLDGVITSWNPAARAMYGYTTDEIIGLHVAVLVPPDLMHQFRRNEERLLRGETVQNLETDRLRKDGTRIRVSLSAFLVRDATGHPIWACVMTRDLTRRMQLEKQLRLLTRRIESVHDEERAQIAHALHDDVADALVGVRGDLDRLAAEMDVPYAFAPELSRLASRIDAIGCGARGIAARLHPPTLHELGLSAAVESHAREFASRHGVDLELRLEPIGPELGRDDAATAFRVLHESLDNVGRHAQASHVRVRLELTPDEVVLEVTDDGRGIGPGEMSSPESLGIMGMHERAAASDGTVSILPAPRRGTTVLLRLPRAPRPLSEPVGLEQSLTT